MRLITTPTMTRSMHIEMRTGNQTNKDTAVKPQSTDKRAVFCEMYLNCKLQINRKSGMWAEKRDRKGGQKQRRKSVRYEKLMPFEEAGCICEHAII